MTGIRWVVRRGLRGVRRPVRCVLALGLLLWVALSGCADRPSPPASAAPPANELGAAVFAANCSVCHALPILSSLLEQNRGRPPGFVYDALTEGNMRRMGAPLDEASRRAVAEFFTGVRFDSPGAVHRFEVSPRCAPERSRFDAGDAAYPSWGNGNQYPLVERLALQGLHQPLS